MNPFKQSSYSKYDPTKFPSTSASILEIDACGSTLYSAWNRIHPSFSVLRGIVDYTLAFSTWTFVSGGKSRSRISYNEWLIAGFFSFFNTAIISFIPKKTEFWI